MFTKKNPINIVKNCQKLLLNLETNETKKTNIKQIEKIINDLNSISQIIFGSEKKVPNPQNISVLADEVFSSNFMIQLIQNLSKFPFEVRKTIVKIFEFLLFQKTQNNKLPTEYISEKFLTILFEGYTNEITSINCGMMIRTCAQDESLAKNIFLSKNLETLFESVESPSFDIASDAFRTLKDLFTSNKNSLSNFFVDNYERCSKIFKQALQSKNYAAKRQYLELISFLIIKSPIKIMLKYFLDSEHFLLIISLMLSESQSIQIEAFHIAKFFIMNPKRNDNITQILVNQSKQIIDFLQNFSVQEKIKDETFEVDSKKVLQEILKMNSKK
ncbi:calcium-binding protein [Anaeramoeba ignava]|uniref:Calcium-binding protein n=1 Tax=Anaeramoeba ignava TaxID=1746090 RepID=A0A9Q0L9Y4_ANAIG|nr:calcium-binding protein [Anaeramoeba ignava]